jgi:protein-S-isoprenylcysteine O-methyltransferase Ste14
MPFWPTRARPSLRLEHMAMRVVRKPAARRPALAVLQGAEFRSMGSRMSQLWRKDKLLDLAAAAPLILWFTLAAVGSSVRIAEIVESGDGAIPVIAQLAQLAFFLIAIVLLVVRRLPTRKAEDVTANIVGVVGCAMPLLVLAAPRAAAPASALLSAFGLIGVIASIGVILWLGRSFSVLPQARGLVTDGPYRHIRHPLYLAEFLVIFSRAFELAQPWPFIVMTLVLASQIARMHFEERILCETYPDYRAYMRRTARLIPGIY